MRNSNLERIIHGFDTNRVLPDEPRGSMRGSMRRMSGRLLELPILIVLIVLGLVVLASIAPAAGLVAAAIVLVAAIVFFGRRWREVRGMRARAAARLEKAAAEHGLALRVHLAGQAELHGGVIGVDPSRRKLAYATPEAASVIDFGDVRSVSLSEARALGASAPSWYSVLIRVEGRQESLAVSTERRARARRWIDELGQALGEDLVRDARATLG